MLCASCGHEAAADFRFCPECGAPAAAPASPREQRKVVTVLFCDVTGSTELGERLDPEALRALLARYFDRMKAIVESHGGTVEKFIGDAVMAVFGVPVLHEDDALRACRAAVEMRDAFAGLGVEGRIGLATGEVVTGTKERLATGDAVNVAARLEQAAAPGEVIVGTETLRLVAGAVESEPLEPLALKGKAEPVAAHRLLAVRGEPARRHAAPMVGRERQRRLLREAFQSVCDDRACHLFTVLGAAGVGKSRLVGEFLDGLDATVVRGRCLSYGEGIAYWPVVEALEQLGVEPDDPAAAAALRVVLGESDQPTTPQQIAWAVRKTLEQSAAERPLVVVWDDLHWGDDSFLDLVEHIADLSRGAPILLLCMARPELLERRAGWAGGKLNATTALLEPLSQAETERLIDALGAVDRQLRARIRDAAEGNPLFVEEMLALAADSGGDVVVVPPSIQALLAARLDQLDPSERAVLERGAVEGKLFHRGAVEALSDEAPEVPERLVSLVRKELVRPDRAQLPGDDAYRFRHLLIRDAAYDALPKSVRAELHLRFDGWLEEHGRGLVELDEISGYHLEQAARYRAELGRPDEALAAAARSRLAAAGRRAKRLQLYPSALALLERARALVPEGELDLALDVDVLDCLFFAGRGEEACVRAAALADRARVGGDRVVELCARLIEGRYGLFYRPETALPALAEAVAEALPVLEEVGDDLALYVAWYGQASLDHAHSRFDDKLRACERAIEHAQRLPWPHQAEWLHPQLANAQAYGSTPWPELLAWLDEDPSVHEEPNFEIHRAQALARLGRVDEARELRDRMIALLRERGSVLQAALYTAHVGIELEYAVHDLAEAERLGRQGCRELEELGERSWLSTASAMLALVLAVRGRLAEAEQWVSRAIELGAEDDVATQVIARQARAHVLARRGEHAAAERVLHEALTLLAETQAPEATAAAHEDLGDVRALAGRNADAVAAYEQAAVLFAQKGNLVGTQRVQARVAELRALPTRS
jgi:class 3 adenylate cyclase/tetratricopeptide (TPR) repeat protein